MQANAEMLQCLKDIKEIVRSGPPCPESLAGVQKLKVSLNEVGHYSIVSSKQVGSLVNHLTYIVGQISDRNFRRSKKETYQ